MSSAISVVPTADRKLTSSTPATTGATTPAPTEAATTTAGGLLPTIRRRDR
jgi:hypothetical protein